MRALSRVTKRLRQFSPSLGESSLNLSRDPLLKSHVFLLPEGWINTRKIDQAQEGIIKMHVSSCGIR